MPLPITAADVEAALAAAKVRTLKANVRLKRDYVDRLAPKLADSLLTANAPQTRAARYSEAARLLTWLRDRSDPTGLGWPEYPSADDLLGALPLTSSEVVAYLDHRNEQHRAATGAPLTGATQKSICAKISSLHHSLHHESPTNHTDVKQYIRTIGRLAPRERPAPPIVLDELRQGIARLGEPSPRELRDRAVVTLLASGQIGPRDLARLHHWDQVRFRVSSTMPRLEIELPDGMIIVDSRQRPRSCPVQNLAAHRRAQPDGPVFAGNSGTPMQAAGLLRIAQRIAKRRGRAFSTGYLNDNELSELILDDLPTSDLADRTILVFGWWLAARSQSIRELRWRDLDITPDQVRVLLTSGKTYGPGESRRKTLARQHLQLDDHSSARYDDFAVCPVHAITAWRDHIEAVFGTVDHNWYVFPRRRGENLDPTSRSPKNLVNDAVQRRLADIVPGATGHSLRAGFITDRRHRRHDAGAIASHVDHKSIQMTETYQRRSTDRSALNPTLPTPTDRRPQRQLPSFDDVRAHLDI